MKISQTFVNTGTTPNSELETNKKKSESIEAHHAVVLPKVFSSFNPVQVNNESLGSLEGCFSAVIPVECTVNSPLYSGNLNGSVTFTGKEIAASQPLHVDIPLLEQTRAAYFICKEALNRTIDFAGFNDQLNEIQLQGSTKEEIVNAMFDVVEAVQPQQSAPEHSSDDAINSILNQVADTQPLNSPAQNFVDSVSSSETGYKLKVESGTQLLSQLSEFIEMCGTAIYENETLVQLSSWCASLNSLIKKTRARNKQHIILISENTVLNHIDSLSELLESYSETLSSITLLEELDSDQVSTLGLATSSLAHSFNVPCFIQPNDEQLIESLALLHSYEGAQETFLFSGHIASNYTVEHGEPQSTWKTAVLGYLEGCISHAEYGWSAEDQLLKLKNQEIYIENNRSQSTKKILPSEEWNDLHAMRVNAVNSIRNTDIALFMPIISIK